MELTDEQNKVLEGIIEGFNEDKLAAIPARDIRTGRVVPILAVFTDKDTYIPVAMVFTPKTDDVNYFKFPDELEDVDSHDGMNFVYNQQEEEQVEEKMGWLDRIRNFLSFR